MIFETDLGRWYSELDRHLARRDCRRHPDQRHLRLRDLAAPVPRAPDALVPDPRELHDPDPGADREPLLPDVQFGLINTLARRDPAAAHRAGGGHHLQAVLRFSAARIPRSGDDGRRDARADPLPHLPADELGCDHGARHHHLHRRVERLPLAVPRGHDRADDERRGGMAPSSPRSANTTSPPHSSRVCRLRWST